MWEHFFKLRSSEQFKTKWRVFLKENIGCCEACPIFFQFVTDYIMERLIKQNYPVHLDTSPSEMEAASLTYEEVNALRYTAGYVIRSLQKKIERSANPLLEELVLCLVDLEEKEGLGEKHESEDGPTLLIEEL